MGTTRDALEAALAAEPESVALHSAYADLLIEEGDPRGEYIRLELALEEVEISEELSREYRREAIEIRARFERRWLGPLAEYTELPNEELEGLTASKAFTFSWKRGWLDAIQIYENHALICQAISRCPMNKLIRMLVVLAPEVRIGLGRKLEEKLVRSVFDMVGGFPLRELSLEFFTLLGDSLCEMLVDNSEIEKLEKLTLNRNSITDDGALLLSQSPHIRKLRSLNLDDNYLSPIGIAALAELGFEVGPQLDNPSWDWGTHVV